MTRPDFFAFYRRPLLDARRLILPLIVAEEPRPDAAMRVTPLAELPAICDRASELGIMGLKLFPISRKHQGYDAVKRAVLDESSLLHRALATVRRCSESLYVETELCVCSHTPDENCMIDGPERTIELLCSAARLQAELGATAVGVANMVPGTTSAVRAALERPGRAIGVVSHLITLSPFYLPWRRATGHTSRAADRKAHLHLDPAMPDRILQRGLDLRREGADCILVEPGLSNLDVAMRLKLAGPGALCAFLVSGESLMLSRASIEESFGVYEMMFRAGYDTIATYQALELAEFAASGRGSARSEQF